MDQENRNGRRGFNVPNLWPATLFVILPFLLILFGPTGQDYRITEKLDPGTGRWVDITTPHPMAPYAWALVGAGWLFWLSWVYRVDRAVATATGKGDVARAGRAAALHLVPIYNLYWVFAWPSVLLKTCQTADQTVKVSWASWLFCLGLLVLSLSVIPPGAVLGAALALAIVLIAAGSLSRHLRRIIA